MPKRNPALTRQHILDAALEVFSSEGFRGATLDQIAATAGLSKPTVFFNDAATAEIYTELLSMHAFVAAYTQVNAIHGKKSPQRLNWIPFLRLLRCRPNWIFN